MKQVNLVEILKKFDPLNKKDTTLTILLAMQEACNQTVDLCAENAETMHIGSGMYLVDKQSILDTKKQII